MLHCADNVMIALLLDSPFICVYVHYLFMIDLRLRWRTLYTYINMLTAAEFVQKWDRARIYNYCNRLWI